MQITKSDKNIMIRGMVYTRTFKMYKVPCYVKPLHNKDKILYVVFDTSEAIELDLNKLKLNLDDDSIKAITIEDNFIICGKGNNILEISPFDILDYGCIADNCNSFLCEYNGMEFYMRYNFHAKYSNVPHIHVKYFKDSYEAEAILKLEFNIYKQPNIFKNILKGMLPEEQLIQAFGLLMLYNTQLLERWQHIYNGGELIPLEIN